MPRVDFEYWIAVGQEDVRLVNGKGNIDLGAGKHTLIWWFVGDQGEKVSITGTVGDRTVVEVKESKIPEGETEGAGARRFTID